MISGDGPYTRRVHALLESTMGVRRALLTTNCTHALEMAALLLDICPGDEVIMPSFTFVSTANAVVLRGGHPVFVDVREDTLNIDERLIEAAITSKTKAIFVVHYAGVACEMNAILAIGRSHGIPVVEDNAHGLYGTYFGRQLGTLGVLATQSFHETKNFTCGEGGALIINDAQYVERAEIIREKGTDRSRFFRGLVDKYSWVAPGSSYLPSDINAAFLLAQLEERDRIQASRHSVWSRYEHGLRTWAADHDVRLPVIPAGHGHPAHLFYLLLPSLEERSAFIDDLGRRGVNAVFHYVPLHDSVMGRELGYARGDLPVTEDISARLVRLPLYNFMTDEEVGQVINACLDSVWERSRA